MKLNKIYLLGLVAVTMLASCSDDNDDYTPGKPAGEYTVSFANAQNLALDMNATEFTVDLVRADSTSLAELTVPIKVVSAPEFVTVPASVTFPQGSTEVSLVVKIGEGMETFTDYTLSLAIDEQYTNPYADSGDSPLYKITFLKEDYQLYATGMFHETVYYEEEWEVEIQYSPMLDLYRIKDAIIEGTHWFFKWNGPNAAEQEFYFTDSTGKKATCSVGGTGYYGWFSGINNPNYGAVYVTVLDGNFIGYDPGDGTYPPEFDFPVSYRVSAGTFGSNYEWIDELVFAN